jgi:hypothetical protein
MKRALILCLLAAGCAVVAHKHHFPPLPPKPQPGIWKPTGRAKIVTVPPRTNSLHIIYPADMTNYYWTLLHSTNLQNWDVVVKNMHTLPTNIMTVTNSGRFKMEYWTAVKQLRWEP